MPQKDGTTVRDNLESIQRQTGEPQEFLEPVECPREVKYIWDFWFSMQKRRSPGQPISQTDVAAWAYLRGIQLSAFELDMIDEIEILYERELRRIRQEDETERR